MVHWSKESISHESFSLNEYVSHEFESFPLNQSAMDTNKNDVIFLA